MKKEQLKFEVKYYKDKLHIINPYGSVGIVCLWSPIKTTLDYLKRIGTDLNSDTSSIAVIGNFYGDGLSQLLSNLLWNPQIDKLIILGQDLSGSAKELINFLTIGVEEVERYNTIKYQIYGTQRYLDTSLPVEKLIGNVYQVYHLGKPFDNTSSGINNLLFVLRNEKSIKLFSEEDRINYTIPINQPNYYPSEIRSHVITRKHPLDAWEEVVCRIMRFGIPSIASITKTRLELQNLKVVITDPIEEDPKHLLEYGITYEEINSYKKQILDGNLPEGLSYSYGNRLRGYWRNWCGNLLDQLNVSAKLLLEDKTTRDAFITLWHPPVDLDINADIKSHPCLVSIFFRYIEDKLTLTATYRAHNTMSAWMLNVYGLMAIHEYVANVSGGLPKGVITIISHSISIDPNSQERYEVAKEIAVEKSNIYEVNRTTGKRTLREDPNGYFAFSIDKNKKEIIVHHKCDGELLSVYTGKTAEEISVYLAKNNTISDIYHAIYVGRQLAICEQQLRE